MPRSKPRPTLVALSDEPGASPTFPFSVPQDVGEPAPADVEAPQVPLLAGRRLGDYRLEALLGRGASATVWRAVDLRLQMPVALKLFTPRGRGGRALLDGVMREARAASRVVSDFVIRVKDAGWFEKDQLGFIAMELCAAFPDPGEIDPGEPAALQVGRTLEQRLPESADEAIRLMAQVARGVADAHREGIFHRDIKPANILVRPGSRRAQVTDFGLTVADLGGDGSVRVVLPGDSRRIILGTPEYMPPEAAAGLPIDLDAVEDRLLLAALDVYGIGATPYALFAGRPPYRPRPGAENGALDIVAQVREDPPPSLDQLTASHLPVSPMLDRVVRKAMSRRPEDRYASAQALAEDLEALADGRPTSLDRDRPLLVARLWLGRHRLQASAAGSVLVLLAAIGTSALVARGLKQEIALLDAQGQAARAEAGEWERAAADAEGRFEAARSREEQALVTVALTSDDLSASRREAEAVTQALDLALAESATWQADSLARAAERDRARQESDLQRERAIQAEAERDGAQASARSQKERAEAAEVELIAARSELSDLERALATELARRSAAESQAAELVRDLRSTQQERARLQAQVSEAGVVLEQAQARIRRLEALLAAAALPPAGPAESPGETAAFSD